MAIRQNAAFMRNNVILILINPSRTNTRLTRHNNEFRLTVENFACLRVNNGVMILSGIAVNFLGHVPGNISTRFKSYVTYIRHTMTPKVLKLKRNISLTTATSFLKRHLVRKVITEKDDMVMRAA